MRLNDTIRVVTPPEPFILPGQIKGEADAEFKSVAIAASTRMIAAPSGWLGRSLGEQTLELSSSRWPWHLPCGPVLAVTGVEYEDPDGVTRTLPGGAYKLAGECLMPAEGHHWPAHSGSSASVRVTYRAGYQKVPEEAVMAVMLAVQALLAAAKEDGGLRTFSVEGAFSRSFNSPELVERTRTKAIESLLACLRIYP